MITVCGAAPSPEASFEPLNSVHRHIHKLSQLSCMFVCLGMINCWDGRAFGHGGTSLGFDRASGQFAVRGLRNSFPLVRLKLASEIGSSFGP